jgi:hypothetical protein
LEYDKEQSAKQNVSNISLSALKMAASSAFSTVTKYGWAEITDRIRKGDKIYGKRDGLMGKETERIKTRISVDTLPTKKELRQQSKQTESADTRQRRHFNWRNGGAQNTELRAATNKSVNINKTFNFFVASTTEQVNLTVKLYTCILEVLVSDFGRGIILMVFVVFLGLSR